MINVYWLKYETNFDDELSPLFCHAMWGQDAVVAENQ